jgi:PAS domain S-box-containing protein
MNWFFGVTFVVGLVTGLIIASLRSRKPASKSTQATVELAASKTARQFLEQILDRISDPIFVKDREHRLFYVNEAECRLSGRPREQLIGKTDYDFFPKEQVDIFWRQDDFVFETGKENVNEENITDSDGALRTIITKKSRYIDETGRPYIVGIIRDITDRKRAEDEVHKLNAELEKRVAERTGELQRANQALEEDIARRRSVEQALSAETERLAVTLRSIGEGVIATDTHLRIQLMNGVAESLTGWPAGDAFNRTLPEILRLRGEGVDGAPADPLQDAIRGGPTATDANHATLTDRKGIDRVIAFNVAQIRAHSGAILGQVVVFRDVTEKQRMDQVLANTQRMESIGVLAGGIAHDFNNLLTGLFGHIELARAALDPKDQAQLDLDEALKAWKRAKDLTLQLLTFSKGGAPVKRVVALDGLVRQTVQFARSGSSMSCEFRLPENLWLCEVDPSQIAQVIDNIVINANQAAPRGHLVVEARNTFRPAGPGFEKAGRYVELVFRDSGPGMSPEVVKRAFEPFYTTKETGNGLGLTTVYSIVKKHEGQVEIQSKVGEGTSVLVYLPAAGNTVSVETPPPRAEPVSSRRVLVVDDEEAIRNVLGGILRKQGHEVVTAPSGEEGLLRYRDALRSAPFDLIILDLTLPGGLSGVETLTRLLTLDPKVRAIASSGYFSDPIMADPKRFGFLQALPKPYTYEQVIMALAETLPASASR